MTFPAGQPVALVTRTASGRDADGNRTYTESFTIATGAFAPGGSAEQVQGQDQVTSQPTVYFTPPVPDLTAIDAIVIDPVVTAGQITAGDRYEIDGTPSPWTWQSTGEQAGLVVVLKRVTG